MITNIDENFGAMDARLGELGLRDNTILVFMTDNGSSGGSELDENGFVSSGYNAGMRGKKASYYEGGHRVPFMLRWPAAGLDVGRDVGDLVCDIDMLPTLSELCGIPAATRNPIDGASFAPLLTQEGASLPERTHFLQYRQATEIPKKWENAVMRGPWRLVAGRELYNVTTDPEQRADVAADHPEMVEELRAAFEGWWDEISPGLESYCPIVIGHPAENPAKLTAMDVMGDVAWSQDAILRAARSTGRWAVEVDSPGTYRFTVRRWPKELPIPMASNVSSDFAARAVYPGGTPSSFAPVTARLVLFGKEQVMDVPACAEEISFDLELAEAGESTLDAWFKDSDGVEHGAYYVYVTRLDGAP